MSRATPVPGVSDTINPPYSYQKKRPMDIVDLCRYFTATIYTTYNLRRYQAALDTEMEF